MDEDVDEDGDGDVVIDCQPAGQKMIQEQPGSGSGYGDG